MIVFCKTKCFFLSKLWYPGETLDIGDEAEIPDHFSKEKAIVREHVAGPLAMSQMVRKGKIETSIDKPTPLSQAGKDSKESKDPKK